MSNLLQNWKLGLLKNLLDFILHFRTHYLLNFQNQTDQSSDTETNKSLEGWKATQFTSFVCPFYESDSASKTYSKSPEASSMLSQLIS